MRKTTWLLAAVLALAPAAQAATGTLSTDVIGLFPKNVGEFAYADMKQAQQYRWFPQLEQQIMPMRFRQFLSFLRSAGIDPDTQVDELAFGAIPAGNKSSEEVMGVALGEFQPDAVEAYLKRLKLPTRQSHGYTLYAFGSGASPSDIFFFFLDPNTAVFGQGEAIDRMLDVRSGGEESLLANDSIFPLISQVNGRGLIWAVLDRHYTQLGLLQLLPDVASAQQTSTLVQGIRAMILSVDASSGIDTRLTAVCASPGDAANLGALLQAGILYRRYQANQSNPDLASMLGQAQVSPNGDQLDLAFNLTETQLLALLAQHTFAVRM